jgi:pyruvate dehydrogenase E2 component (dihydrolipoamide acetyltransferase)
MSTIEVKVPDIGDYKDVPVIEVFVKAGDAVQPESPLVTLESDKATLDVPAPTGGKIRELRVKVGDRVSEGSVIVVLDADGAAAPAAKTAGASPVAVEAPVRAEEVAPEPEVARAIVPEEPPLSAEPAVLDVTVPEIGDYKDVPVIEVFVKPGDKVTKEQPLVTLESDKATLDVPAPADGVVKEVRVKVGDRVSEGSAIAALETAGTAPAAKPVAPPPPAPARPAPAPAPTAAPAPAPTPSPPPTPTPGAVVHASPAVRYFARELGVDLTQVTGSGPRGRIRPEDVKSHVKQSLASPRPAQAEGGGAGLNLLPWPTIDFSKFGPTELVPLSKIKRSAAANLARNWVMIPHVTNHDEADITELEAFRVKLNEEHGKEGPKVTLLAFLIKACVAALKRYPTFNASLAGDNLVLKRYYHIGFAVDTPNGLVVPALRDADQKGILQIATEMAALSAKAREGKLAMNDLQGATFTISSLGGIGGTSFSPIINAPEVAILGVSRSAMRPVWDGAQFVPRLMLPLSLSWDHRVVDGASAARFNAYLGSLLGDLRRLVLRSLPGVGLLLLLLLLLLLGRELRLVALHGAFLTFGHAEIVSASRAGVQKSDGGYSRGRLVGRGVR